MLASVVGQKLGGKTVVADLDGERPIARRHEAGGNEAAKHERDQQKAGDQLTRASGEQPGSHRSAEVIF
jgi:hypothetical protein